MEWSNTICFQLAAIRRAEVKENAKAKKQKAASARRAELDRTTQYKKESEINKNVSQNVSYKSTTLSIITERHFLPAYRPKKKP